MPKEGISVYFSGVDQMSPVLSSLADKTRALDKASQELQQTYVAKQKANQGLIDQRTKLKAALEEQKIKVSELRAEYKKYSNDVNGSRLRLAIEEQDALKDKLKEVEDQLSANRKAFNENRETIRKGLLGGESSGSDLSAIWGGLGIGAEVSSLVGQAGGTLLSSALGSDMGSIASNALSSAITGASLGTAIAPGIGTAIGAALGGLSGLAGGAIEQWGNKDDAFKDYYGGLYDDVKGRSGEMVEEGSTIAGGREQTRMAFSQRLGGDDQAAAYLAQVEKMAANTNYEYDEIVGYAKLLLNSYDPGEVFGVLRDLSDATAGLDLSSSDVNMMISGLSRMRTTGKATQEYLNYFRERGVDVDQALADDLGVDKSAVTGMVSKGQIGGEDAAQAILDFIQKEFGGLSDGLASTYDAMVDNLGDMEASINAAGGDAYNSLRKSGVSAQQEAYEGELGEALKEINAVLGENQARKENLQEQYAREALETVLLGKRGTVFSREEQVELNGLAQQYAAAKRQYEESGRTDGEAAATMESLYEQAQMLGQAYFDNSDEVARLNEIERDEIDAIRDVISPLETAHQRLYELNQTLSKGLAAGWALPEKEGDESAPIHLGSARQGYAQLGRSELPGSGGLASPRQAYARKSHAFGLPRVPYDEYPALLHMGERVLTAEQARAQDAQSGAPPLQLTVTGNNFVGTGEEMADQVAEIIVRKLVQAAVAAAPK